MVQSQSCLGAYATGPTGGGMSDESGTGSKSRSDCLKISNVCQGLEGPSERSLGVCARDVTVSTNPITHMNGDNNSSRIPLLTCLWTCSLLTSELTSAGTKVCSVISHRNNMFLIPRMNVCLKHTHAYCCVCVRVRVETAHSLHSCDQRLSVENKDRAASKLVGLPLKGRSSGAW